jgi:maleate isomerase
MKPYAAADQRKKVGHITPSSNTVLEPLTACIADACSQSVSHHFARIKVEAISLEPRYAGQFTAAPMLAAAELLADAHVDAILWNGTSGGWSGIDADHELCALIEDHTGIPASTSTLAQLEAMSSHGITSFGLAVPYTDDVTARIVDVYGEAGFYAVATANAGLSTNRDFAYLTEDDVRSLVRAADHDDAQCVLVVCTGVAAAPLIAELEAELGKPIIDSVAVVLWKGLRMVGAPIDLRGWGSLLEGGQIGQTVVR